MAVAVLAALVIYGVIVIVSKPQQAAAPVGQDANPGRWPLPFKPLQVIAMVLALFLVPQVIMGLVLGTVLAVLGYSQMDADTLLSDSGTVQFVYMLLVDGAVLLLVYWLLKRRGFSLRTIGFKRPKLDDAGMAIMAYVLYFAALLVALNGIKLLLPGVDWDQKQELGFNRDTVGLALIPVFISLVVLPPLAEETMMRGLLYSGLRSSLPVVGSAVITSVMFGAAHLFNGGVLLWAAAIDTFILSLALVWLREKTDSLWPCIMLHAIKNGLAFLYLFVLRI